MVTTLSPARAPSPPQEKGGCVPRIEVSVSDAPGEVLVRIAGDAHVSQTGELADGLLRLSARRPSVVALDLGGLNSLSCLANGVLVTFCRGVVRAGGRVRLAASLQEPVREALARAELLALFESPGERDIATRAAS